MADDLRDPASIVIVAPNWLGDAVMALPAIEDVRRRYPRARLAVAARRAVASLFEMVPSVNEVLTLEWGGQLLRRSALSRDLSRLGALGAGAALLLPNSFATAWLVRRAGIGERWGYATDARGPLLTRAVRRARGSRHQGAYYQQLVRGLGIDNGPLEPAIALRDDQVAEARALLTTAGWDGQRPLVIVAPGAAYGTAKRWLPRSFARVIDAVVASAQAHCVLVGSAADGETIAQVVQAIAPASRAFVSDLGGCTTLAMLAAVLGLGRACVSNDSGAMHLAAAAGAPVAALFGPTREYETAPLGHRGVPAEVLIHPVWCRPCMLRECPIDHRCMQGLAPGRVIATVERMLTRAGAPLDPVSRGMS